MNFSEQPPSKQWAALKFKGQKLAEVWFKPEGEPLALIFRIPQSSFQLRGIGGRLTAETLLKSVAIAPEEVESWRPGSVADSTPDESDLQLNQALPQPPADVAHLEVYVRLKPQPPAVAGSEGDEPGAAAARWQDLEGRWNVILGLDATVDSQRISMDGLRAEMEAALQKTLTGEEKLHALSSDVAQWNKAKSRLRYSLPKTKDFIHRATWAASTPERKRLGEIFKNPGGADISPSEMDKVSETLEVLRKDRQVLSGLGVAVYQECKGITDEVQGALRRLQSNAAARALKKKGAAGGKRKPF